MKYIDMHCDTLEKCFLKGHEDFTSLPEFMIDVAEAGGIYYGQSTSFSSSMQFVRELKSYSEHR